MPNYVINIASDKTFTRNDLDALEDVVYDCIVDNFGGSVEVDADGVGLTDVEAVFN